MRSRPARPRWAATRSRPSAKSPRTGCPAGSAPGAGQTQADVDASLRAGVRHVNISSPMSRLQIGVKLGVDVDGAAERVRRVVGYAISRGLSVALGGEDSSRADPRDIGKILRAAAQEGATRFRFADTLGLLDPFGAYESIKRVREETDLADRVSRARRRGTGDRQYAGGDPRGRPARFRDGAWAGRTRWQRRA